MLEETRASLHELISFPKACSANSAEPVAIFVSVNGTRQAVEKAITYSELTASMTDVIREQEKLSQKLREAKQRVLVQQRKRRTPAGKLYSRPERRQMLAQAKQAKDQLADELSAVRNQKRILVEEAGWVLASPSENPLTVRLSSHGRRSELISGTPLNDPEEIAWRVCVSEVFPELWGHPQQHRLRENFLSYVVEKLSEVKVKLERRKQDLRDFENSMAHLSPMN